MKKLIPIIATFMFFVLSTSAYAMDWRYGVLVSYDNTGFDTGEANISTTSGFSIGGMFGYDFIDYFGIQSGINFSLVNLNDADWNASLDMLLSEDIRLYYLSLPIYLQAKLPVREVTLLLEAGPQFYCGVGSKGKVVLQDYNISESYIDVYEADGIDAFDYLKRFNCVMHLGIGAEYMSARLMVGYNWGLYNIANDTAEVPELKSYGFQVTAGYIF